MPNFEKFTRLGLVLTAVKFILVKEFLTLINLKCEKECAIAQKSKIEKTSKFTLQSTCVATRTVLTFSSPLITSEGNSTPRHFSSGARQPLFSKHDK